ncbi:Krr1-domain-containing protein [Delitschia confertaspora ATCC 74209]|uniref:Krr1-domain-containing protein n=1 Tax=Delitschia confertaspora ATCC 74209 TaxID=1513339 RepID=A0A9P4MNX2_9PLEO|nr:Krr1-domain-containing protein [Delitschia confertaspora ATCC 74209]
MGKDKSAKPSNEVKPNGRSTSSHAFEERPAKKAKLLDETDGEETDEDVGGVKLKVNEEYARRFEHNKKRAEMHRLEEKYGKNMQEDDESETDSEDDEDEDDDAELITEDIDAAISATLEAIRKKDPRVYDEKATFYPGIDEEEGDNTDGVQKEKPMTLKDYHRKNLLEGKFEVDEDEDAPVKTYAQEQEEVRKNLVKEMHAAAEADGEEDDFMVAKPKQDRGKTDRVVITERDVENADKDPETFLSNFMAARAWRPTDGAKWKPLESDDEEEDAQADDFEAAYNLYFEDPAGSNEKIVTYARDTIASTSVRRDEASGRKKAREAARAKREAEKKQREQELARLRKLKIDEMEEKVKHIRKAGGLKGRDFKVEEWTDVLEADWSDDRWDEEMRKRFGDNYYEQDEGDASESDDEEEGEKKKKKKKPKKPKWDDDIDIHDLVPDFDDEELEKPTDALFDVEEDENTMDVDGGVDLDNESEDDEETSSKSKSLKQKKADRAEAKSSARRDRRLIENLVDANLSLDTSLATKSKGPTGFRYRETSPTSFGLTARDILLADDAKLNEFAGLKKLATFRDPAKKKKDKKALSKKARLRQWRLETFGDEEGPKGGFEVLLGEEAAAATAPREYPKKKKDREAEVGEDGIKEGERKKKKRNRKRKAGEAEI